MTLAGSVPAPTFQRVGAVSNSHVGYDFEAVAQRQLAIQNIEVHRDFGLQLSAGRDPKWHRFDLGADDPAVIVECKSHTWTSGGNAPSAKLTVWNEAMYYFSLAPSRFRKIFFVLKDLRRQESLAEYWVRRYAHLIPTDVEVWEYCTADKRTAIIL